MHVIMYRPHNALKCETKIIGPFAAWADAYEYLCSMPALGIYMPDGVLNSPGVKYIDELISPQLVAPCDAARGLDL